MLEQQLTKAIRENDILQVALLLAKTPMDKYFLGILLLRACSEDFTCIDLFLDMGADIDFNPAGMTPLMYACQRGSTDVVRDLLERGANPNKTDKNNLTALHRACNRGYLDIVKLLIEKGAQIDVRYSDGITPLHIACIHGYADIVEFLINNGADIGILTPDGRTAWQIAKHGCQWHVVTILEQYTDQATK